MGVELADRQARFFARCTENEWGCWIWPTQYRSWGGWGPFSRAYSLWIGEPPKRESGLELDHTCGRGMTGCVNPFHLDVVTKQENRLRAVRRGGRRRQMGLRDLKIARSLHRSVAGGPW